MRRKETTVLVAMEVEVTSCSSPTKNASSHNRSPVGSPDGAVVHGGNAKRDHDDDGHYGGGHHHHHQVVVMAVDGGNDDYGDGVLLFLFLLV